MENKEKGNAELTVRINLKVMKFIVGKSKELEKSYPSIAYYCLLYVVHKLHSYVKATPTDKDAMNMLKTSLKESEELGPTINRIDYNDLSKFCDNLIKAAEKKSDKLETLKSAVHLFYTSQIFYEILGHFQELNEEEKKKYKYAKYKTVYLKKCIDENRNPNEESTEVVYPMNSAERESQVEQEENNIDPYGIINSKSVEEKEVPQKDMNIDTYKEEDHIQSIQSTYFDISDSLKHAQHAVNALMFEDVETAKLCLKRSLAALEKKP